MIRFLWIKEFGCLKNASFNFYGPLRYSYDAETKGLKEEQRLTSVENTQFIPRFFSGDVSKSPEIACTLIVGENRSGKTTLLRFISRLLAEDFDECGDFFLVWESGGTTEKVLYSRSNALSQNETKYSVSRMKSDIANTLYYNGLFNSFSPGSDGGYGGLPGEYNGFVNISTDALLSTASLPKSSVDKLAVNVGPGIDIYHDAEIEKQIRFFLIGKGVDIVCDHFGIVIPNDVTVFLDASYLGAKARQKEQQDPWERLFWKFLELLEEKWDFGSSVKPDGKIVFIYQTLAHYLYRTLTGSSEPTKSIICDAAVLKLFSIKSGKDGISGNVHKDLEIIFEKFKDVDREFEQQYQRKFRKMKGHFDQFSKAATQLGKAVKDIDRMFKSQAIIRKSSFEWVIPIADFQNALVSMHELAALGHWMRFDWRNMATGEKQILSLFSRIDRAVASASSSQSLGGLLILLDEPEVGMHPRWQQLLLAGIFKYFTALGSSYNLRKIQLVFSSNQPIMISDLPKRSVCYLKYNSTERSVSVVPDSEVDSEKMVSYCANIGGILSSSFFLNEGYVGKFAQTKVDVVISKAKSGESVDPREIELIDSQIVKSYIESLLRLPNREIDR